MSPNFAAVFEAAEALPVAERRELIDLLLEGLDDPLETDGEKPPSLSEAWRQEIARRSAEYDAGREETVTWEAVQKRWQPQPAEELKAELKRRIAAYEADPRRGLTWEEVEAHLRRPR